MWHGDHLRGGRAASSTEGVGEAGVRQPGVHILAPRLWGPGQDEAQQPAPSPR